MNKIIFFTFFFTSLYCNAQYYNPYNPYMNLQANQNAYEMGRKTMAALMAYDKGVNDLVSSDYSAAWEHFAEAVKNGNPAGYEGLGLMCEMGIGVVRDTPRADDFYKSGARGGNSACILAISRIESNGHYTADYKKTFLTNLRNMKAAQNGSVGGYNGNAGYSGAGSSGNSSYRSSGRRTCPGCNGTGKGVDQITYVPSYSGYDNSRYCSTCGRTTSAHSHHSPMCRTCYGKGYVE